MPCINIILHMSSPIFFVANRFLEIQNIKFLRPEKSPTPPKMAGIQLHIRFPGRGREKIKRQTINLIFE